MRLLLIEDGPKIVAFVKKGLTENGFVVEIAPVGDDGFFHWQAAPLARLNL